MRGVSGLRRVLGLVIGFGCSTLSAAPARGQAQELGRGQAMGPVRDGHFVLDIKECPKTLAEDVRRLVGIEVGDLLRDQGEGALTDADTLTIRCAGNLVRIEASGAAETSPLEKPFRLDDFPGDAAPRALALASLELMAARNSTVRERVGGNRSSLEPAQEPAPTKPQAAIAPPAVRPSPRPESSNIETRFGLSAAWLTFPARYGPTLWGGQVQASSVFERLWRLSVDAELSTGQKAVSLGETRATQLTLGASFGVQRRLGNVESGIGLGGRIGAVRLSGTSVDPTYVRASAVWRPWGGPMVSAHLASSFGRFAPALAVEAGLPLLQPEGRAGSSTAIALDGPWAAITLGASIRL